MEYRNQIISDDIKQKIYVYIENISVFDSENVKIDASSYQLKYYCNESSYIFSIDYIQDSNLIALDGIVKVENNKHTLIFSDSKEHLVKSEVFSLEEEKVIRTSKLVKDNIVKKTELDKGLFFKGKAYKKD